MRTFRDPFVSRHVSPEKFRATPLTSRLLCLLVSVLAVGALRAADVSLTASDPVNSDSWDEAGRWSNAAAPSAGNNYFTAGFTLRTPNNLAGNTTFGGGSLTINRGQVLYKGSGSRTITINNLTLDGGNFADGNGNTTVTLAGNGIMVNTTGCFDSTTDSSDRHIVVNSAIFGSGIITNRGNGTVQFTSTASTFSGKWILQGNGSTRVTADASLGAVPGDYVADSIIIDGGRLLNRDTDVAISANRGITLTSLGGRLEAGWSKNLAINSVITGGGGLTIVTDSTPGIIFLNAVNTYTGPTVVQNNGWVQVDGSLDAASAVTVQTGGLLLGNGTIDGSFTGDANANVGPGGLFAPGTLTLNNAANLNGCILHIDLADTSSGANDLLTVNGDLNLSGTITVSVTPLLGTLGAGPYRLINYTGNFSGSAANFVAAPSRYTITFDTSTPGQVNMTVQDAAAANLVWKGDNILNSWDFATPSWLNGGSADTFLNGDNVLLDDTGANLLPISVASSALVNTVLPKSVLVDSTKDYTLSGGRFGGPMSLTKRGTGVLTLGPGSANLPNYFTGTVTIDAGLVKPTYPRAFGSIAGGTIVKSGATLDVNGQDLGFEPFTVEGEGVGGAGVLVNYGGGQNNALRSVTMTGNTTVGGTGRFDIRNAGGNAFLSTGANGYKLTKKGPNQFSLVGVAVDDALAEVDVQEGIFGYETTSTLGDPTKTMTLGFNTSLKFWNLNYGFYKPLVLNGGTTANIDNGSGSNNIVGPVTLAAQSVWNAGGTSLAVYSGIQGNGGLTKVGGSPLYLYGTNTYAGPTLVSGGRLVLGADSSLSNSALIALSSGTTLDASAAPSGLVLNGVVGQTLAGSGILQGNLTAGNGATVIAGSSAGTLTINGNAALTDGSTAVFELGATTNIGGTVNDLAIVNGNLSFSGTVTLRINALAPLDTVNPYTIVTYTGILDAATATINVVSDSRYTFVVDPVTVPGTIRVLATAVGLGVEDLTWQGNVVGSESLWDVKTTANWSNSLSLADTFFLGDRVRFDDTAQGLTVNLTGTVNPATLTVSNVTKDFVWTGAGKLSGVAGLVKAGAGKLTIANTGVNDNAGTTTISGGSLEVGDGGTAGNLSSAAIANSGTLVFNRSDTFTVANVISGGGQLEKEGTGVMVLSAAQPGLTGSIHVKEGTLRTGNGTSLGTVAAGTTVADGATLDVNGQTLGNEAITVSGVGVGGAGAIYNSGASQQNATRNVILAGDTTFGGINRWDIRSNGVPSALTGNNYALTKVGPNETYFVNLQDTGLGNITINQGILGFEGSSTMGNPSATVTINPGATMAFYGNNNSANPLSKVVVMNNGNWINNNGDNYFNGLVTLNGPNTLNMSATLRLLGVIGGTGTLIKAGGGTLVLGADETYSGNTVVSGGVLRVGNGGTSGSIVGTIYNSGRVDIERADTYIQPFNVVGTGGMGIRTAAGVTWDGTATINISGNVEVGRDVAGKLIIQGTANPRMGHFLLGNPANIAGEVLQTGGDVVVSNSLRVGHWPTETSTYTLENGTITLVGTPAGAAAGSAEQDGVFYIGVDGTGIFTQRGGTVRAHGLVLDNRGNSAGDDTFNLEGGTFVVGPSGIATANAANTYVVYLTGGTIAAWASWSSALNMTLTGAQPGTVFDTGPNTIQLSGSLSGLGGLNKVGAGTLVLSGVNSYAGNTGVDGGTLSVVGTVGSGMSAVVITNGTLTGTGTILDPVQIPAGATLAPGLPIGTLTCSYATAPAVTLAGSAVMEISKTGTTRANDKLVAPAGIVFGGTLTVQASGDSLADGDWFQLFESTSYGNGFTSVTLPTLPAGLQWDTGTLATDGKIRVNATVAPRLQVTVTGSGTEQGLTISWDAIYGNHSLQAQTNAIGEGISTNWYDVLNAPNPLVIQPVPANENVFFRLFRP